MHSTSAPKQVAYPVPPRVLATICLATAGCVLFAFLSLFLPAPTALVFGFAPLVVVAMVCLGWTSPLAIAGLVLLFVPLQPLPTMAMEAAGLWYAQPLSSLKDIGLLLVMVGALRSDGPKRLTTSDWFLFALVAIALGCRVFFGGATVGLKDDLEFGIAYAAGRTLRLSFETQCRWARRAVVIVALLSVVAILEYWYGGIVIRMILMRWSPADIPSQFTATGYSAYRVAATLNGPVEFGCLCAFTLVIAAAYREAMGWKFRLLLIPVGLGLLLSVTRSAWAAALLGLGIVEWKRGNKARVVAVIAGSAVLFLALAPLLGLGDYLHATSSGEDASLQGHRESIQTYLQMAVEKPLGSGPGTVGPRALERSSTAINVESSFIAIALEYGILGGAMFTAFGLAVLYSCWGTNSALGACTAGILGGYLFTMMVLPTHMSFPIASWAWLPAGVAVSCRNRAESDGSASGDFAARAGGRL